MTKQPTRLTDMEIETVGLVDSGMVNKKFLLIKRNKGGGNMPDDNVETQEVEVNDSLLEKVADKMRELFATKEDVTQALEKVAGDEEEETIPDETPETEQLPEAVQKQLDAIEKVYGDRFSILEKANTELKEQLEKTGAKLTEAEELAKAEKDARLKRVFLEKAGELRVLPTSRTELGEMLYELSKAVSQESFDKWFELLKATDQQAFAAGLFNEMGTTASPEELEIVEKVEKKVEEGADAKEALLSLSKAEQAELRGQMAYSDRKRGGK